MPPTEYQPNPVLVAFFAEARRLAALADARAEAAQTHAKPAHEAAKCHKVSLNSLNLPNAAAASSFRTEAAK